jgi:hypothetical protein
MKTKIILISIFLLTGIFKSSAQDDDKIDNLKISFFTKELDLSKQEAQEFWPIYNFHSEKYENLKDNKWRSIIKRLKKVDELSEEEANKLLEDYREYKLLRYQYREDFINELQEVISDKKIMQLKHAEYEFDKKLLEQYRSANKN